METFLLISPFIFFLIGVTPIFLECGIELDKCDKLLKEIREEKL